jgi:large subunit ribosomal protein L18
LTALKGRPLRQKRIRSKVKGTLAAPRLSVFRSNQRFYGSLIDDALGKTLAAASDREVKSGKGKPKTEKAYEVGVLISEKAKKKKIKKVVFDRSGYKYHGRVRAFAEGARSGGLEF